MSGSEAASSNPSVMWLVVPFLDPRRWLGTLFALVGIAASIFTAMLPSILGRRVFPPSVSTVALHTRTLRPAPTLDAVPRSPLKSPKQLPVVPAPRLSARRSRTDDDIPLRSSASSSVVPLRRSSSTGCIFLASLSLNRRRRHDLPSDKYPLPTSSDTGSNTPNSASVPFRPLQQTQFISSSTSMVPNPHKISPDNNSTASKSSGGLGLSTSSEHPSPALSREISQKSKISFHLPLRKPGGARRSTTGTRSDIKGKKLEENVAFEDESHLSSGTLGSSSSASSSSSSSSSVQVNDQSREPLQSRRKFLLFSKDCRFRREKKRNSSISLAHPTAPDDVLMTTRQSRASWDGVRFSRANTSPSPLPSSSPDTANSPLHDPTNIPPARPGRSDPYKTHGVPVPGSERSVAFLKAERQMRKRRMRSASETPSTRGGTPSPKVDSADVDEPESPDQFGVLPPEQSRRRRTRGFSWCPSESSSREEAKPRKDKTRLRRSWQVRPSSGDSAKDRAYNSDTVIPL